MARKTNAERDRADHHRDRQRRHRINERAADDDVDVHQPITDDRMTEAQGNQSERQSRHRRAVSVFGQIEKALGNLNATIGESRRSFPTSPISDAGGRSSDGCARSGGSKRPRRRRRNNEMVKIRLIKGGEQSNRCRERRKPIRSKLEAGKSWELSNDEEGERKGPPERKADKFSSASGRKPSLLTG
jgi:hypothetical protein